MKQPIDLARQFLAVADNELLDLFTQYNLPSPPMSDVLDELNPYAVPLRYDLLDDMETPNRERAKEIVGTIRQWAVEQIQRFTPA